MTIYVGVDCGLTGAIAFIDEQGHCTVEDLPTVDLPGKGMITRKIDGLALARLVRERCPVDQAAMIFVEQVSTMGGKNNAVQTQGSLMRTLGAIEAVLEVLRLKPTMLHPQTWKKFYGLDANKAKGLLCARQLYPTAPLKLAKHHNRAEALLIAHYGMRVRA